MKSPPRYPVIGTPIAAVTFEDALRLLASAPADGRRVHVHFCTVHSLVAAADDPVLRDAFGAPDSLALPDGVPVVWVGKVVGQVVERVCGPDVMPALLDRSRASNARHYFYGGAPGVADRLAERMQAAYPGLDVVGTYSPPFGVRSTEEEAADVAQINAARPDYVWVGLGAPKQDLWPLATARSWMRPSCWPWVRPSTSTVAGSSGDSLDAATRARVAVPTGGRAATAGATVPRDEHAIRGLAGPDPVVRRAPAAQATSLTRRRSIDEGQRPSARSIAGIVRRMIMMSSHGDQRSMYSRSFLTQ